MSDIPIFADLQSFIVHGKFVVKEVAVLRRGKELVHYIFDESMPWNLLTKAEKNQACWLTSNHHNLLWSNGDIAYSRSKTLIRWAIRGEMQREDSTRVCEGS